MPERLKICLFDIDGTLLRSGGAGQAAMEETMRAEFNIDELKGDIKTAGRTDRAIVSELMIEHDIEPTEAIWNQFREAYFERLPVHLSQLDGAVLPGVFEILEQLNERPHMELGLLTGNFQHGAKLKLSHFGIHDQFEFGGFGDEHHHRDDVARDAVKQVQERFGDSVPVEDITIIGDTPADVRCARAVGAVAVAVSTGIFSPEQLAEEQPDHLLIDLSDTEELVSLFQ